MVRSTVSTYRPSTAEGIRVINALMLRELKTRFGENHLGFVWLFIEPLLFIIPVILFWSATHTSSHGLPFVEFMMTGYPPFVLWRNSVSRSLVAISGNSGLLYHRMITPARILLARCLLEASASFISIATVYLVFIYIKWVRVPHSFPFFFYGWLYMALVAWSCSVFLCSLAETSKFLTKIVGTFTYLMFGIGGSFYMVEWMPRYMQDFLVWIPTVQAFELIRYGYFGDATRTHWSPFNMLVCVMVPATLGLHILKFAREHMELD